MDWESFELEKGHERPNGVGRTSVEGRKGDVRWDGGQGERRSLSKVRLTTVLDIVRLWKRYAQMSAQTADEAMF